MTERRVEPLPDDGDHTAALRLQERLLGGATLEPLDEVRGISPFVDETVYWQGAADVVTWDRELSWWRSPIYMFGRKRARDPENVIAYLMARIIIDVIVFIPWAIVWLIVQATARSTVHSGLVSVTNRAIVCGEGASARLLPGSERIVDVAVVRGAPRVVCASGRAYGVTPTTGSTLTFAVLLGHVFLPGRRVLS